VPDLLGDRAMVWVDRLYFFWVFVGLLIPAAVVGLLTRLVGRCAVGDALGRVRANLPDAARDLERELGLPRLGLAPVPQRRPQANNPAVALLALGEGWHNNHHAFPTSARPRAVLVAVRLVLRADQGDGEGWRLAWNVRVPSEAALATKRVAPAKRGAA
jgi:stearoyl-CoA desaturase (delta-9 desaturase)